MSSFSWKGAAVGGLAGAPLMGIGAIPGALIGGFLGGGNNKEAGRIHETPMPTSFRNLPDAGAQSAYNAPDFSDSERRSLGGNMYGGMPQMGQMPQQPRQPQPNLGGMPGMGQSAPGTMGLSQPTYGLQNRMTGMAPSMRPMGQPGQLPMGRPMGGPPQGPSMQQMPRQSMYRPQHGQIPYPQQPGAIGAQDGFYGGGQSRPPMFGGALPGAGMGMPQQGGMQTNGLFRDAADALRGWFGESTGDYARRVNAGYRGGGRI